MGSLHEKQEAISNSISHIVSTPEKCVETTVCLSQFRESAQTHPEIENKFIPVFAVAVFEPWPNFRLTLSVDVIVMVYRFDREMLDDPIL